MSKPKDPSAVSLGKRGGAKKVPKGFSKMDPERRKQLAVQAAEARWGKQHACPDGQCPKCKRNAALREKRQKNRE